MTYSISPTGLDFNFAAAQDAADEERTLRTWSSSEELAIYDPYGDDLVAPEATDDNDFTYEDNVAFELDCCGRIDLLPHEYEFGYDDIWSPGGFGLMVYSDRFGEIRLALDYFDYIAERQHRFSELDDKYLPSFSSNREPHHLLTNWEDDAKWHRRLGNRAKKLAKRHCEYGRRLRKDRRQDRCGMRQVSFEARHRHSDWYEEIQSWLNPNIDLRPDYLTESYCKYADGQWKVILLDDYRVQNQRELEVYDRELESDWYGLMLDQIESEPLRLAA